METLVLDGVKYYKAKALAEELGYTSDYLGQLCRSGKVDGHLVGRTWYVNKQALLEHKDNRYKNTKPEISPEVERAQLTGHPLKSESERGKPKFYQRATHNTDIKYDTDETDLIPQTPSYKASGESASTESHKLSVDLADAENVRVKSQSEETNFSAPEKTRTVFQGDLVVEGLPEIDYEEEALEDEKASKNIDISSRAENKKGKEEVVEAEVHSKDRKRKVKLDVDLDSVRHEVAEQVKDKSEIAPQATNLSGQHDMKLNHEHEGDSVDLKVTQIEDLYVTGDAEEDEPKPVLIGYTMTAAMVGLTVVAVMLGMELTWYIDQNTVATAYTFSVEKLLAAVYDAI